MFEITYSTAGTATGRTEATASPPVTKARLARAWDTEEAAQFLEIHPNSFRRSLQPGGPLEALKPIGRRPNGTRTTPVYSPKDVRAVGATYVRYQHRKGN